MAIRDLFHACPCCGGASAIAPAGREERCRECNAAFHRGAGGTVTVRHADGREESLPAADWLARMPAPADPTPHAMGGPERAVLRVAGETRPLRKAGELVGWGERFGPKTPGSIELTPDALVFRADQGHVRTWPLQSITAVQPTSSALQVKARGQPVAYIRFLEGSVRLWEHRLQQRLRALYHARGLGEIVEFQPRISSR